MSSLYRIAAPGQAYLHNSLITISCELAVSLGVAYVDMSTIQRQPCPLDSDRNRQALALGSQSGYSCDRWQGESCGYSCGLLNERAAGYIVSKPALTNTLHNSAQYV